MNQFHLTDIQLYGLIKKILQADSVNQATIRMNGYSMTPFIKNGSIVSIKPFNKKKGIHIGDVVAVSCPNNNRIIVHRVIRKRNHLFLLKGDNNIHHDGWFSKENIIGIAHAVPGKRFSSMRCRFINTLIAAGSKTGLLNQLIIPFLRQSKRIAFYEKK